jgi:hypothetical protein
VVRHDAAVVVDDKNGTAAHAGILQSLEDGIERYHGGQHPGEIVVHVLQGHGHNKCWPVARR